MNRRVKRGLAAASLILLALPAAVGSQPRSTAGKTGQQRGPEARDWLRTAVRTPEGGFRIGNPNARVKVIEYLSLTCPHCAEFAHQGSQRLLQNYVRPGQVSVEYRN